MDNYFQKDNFYFLQTVLAEIPQYDTISFALFDTLLLRKVLHPDDLLQFLADRVEELLGIFDFQYIRSSMENEVRQHSGKEDVTTEEIYCAIGERHPHWPIDQIKKWEYELELEYTQANPLIEKVFRSALDHKKTVWLISDMSLPYTVVTNMLESCGLVGCDEIYLSGELGLTKHTGSLYRHIAQEHNTNYDHWLHIGNNRHSDALIPRQLGMTAALYRCPTDCYLMERTQRKQETVSGCLIPETSPPNTAGEINTLYTDTEQPEGEVVIEVQDVSMMFNMSSEKVDNIKEYLICLLKHKLKFQEFWALQNISFAVQKGEKVGLVGLNGSGKSTMLKIISGVMKPTKGSVRVKGSIAPLIELGAGFDFELSARENVFLNGAILGYSHEEMMDRYESIIEFAELREFEDIAIKNFSSGMIARLGFAIATSHVPDILIIDEILSVGDFSFQEKCHKRMDELTGEGATVLFVSHSSDDIINMCNRAIWIDHGHLVQQGQAQFIVETYLNE